MRYDFVQHRYHQKFIFAAQILLIPIYKKKCQKMIYFFETSEQSRDQKM